METSTETLERLDRDGCARYVLTDVARDGTLTGPNLELLKSVCAATRGLALLVGYFIPCRYCCP